MFRSNDREADSHMRHKDGGDGLAGSPAELGVRQACPQPCVCEATKFAGKEVYMLLSVFWSAWLCPVRLSEGVCPWTGQNE